MKATEYFAKNYELFKKYGYGDTDSLKIEPLSTVNVFESDQKDILNLSKKIENEEHPFYDQKDPFHDAAVWASTLKLKDTNLVIVYGLGLGYYYEPLSKWLSEDSKRRLLFIEDDKEVLLAFLQTEYASFLLSNPAVSILYFEKLEASIPKFDAVFKNYMGYKHKISAINLYLRRKSSDLMKLNNVITFLFTMNQMVLQEYNRFSLPFFLNYYLNLFTLPESYRAKPLWNAFKNVPAIICGAGPSLSKNIEDLKGLQDKALIFGGSTSVNALNAAGIFPHLGVGIDPNPAQLHRIISNYSFEVPYFVNFRMNSFALNAIHGDHLYVNGTSPYEISKWIDKELNIAGPNIVEGYNVINYALSIAVAMGCNPIVLVGVDLAYTDGESYAELTPEHPLYAGDRFNTKTPDEELITRTDINGKPIFTLWKWIMESVWYSKFVLEFPRREIINASEGGLGFPGVPSKSLKELSSELFEKSYDFSGMIHSHIQSLCHMPENVTVQAIENILKSLKASTETCITHCDNINKGYQQLIENIASGKEYPTNLLTPEIIENVSLINDETAYKHTLILFVQHLADLLKQEIAKLELNREWLSKEELDQQLAQIHLSRFTFVKKAAEKNIGVLDNALSVMESHQKRIEKCGTVKQPDLIHKNEEEGNYAFEGNKLTINDPSLGITIEKTFENINEYKEFYDDVVLKIEQYYEKDKLVGPSRYFNDKGVLLSETWYVDGLRVGKAKSYFQNSAIHSIKRYLNGVFHGKQEYYYQDGHTKSLIPYTEGHLDGEVLLYYPNGQIKRKIHFKNGQKDGIEEFWNYEGKKISEGCYFENKSHGKSQFWNEKGALLKEVEFEEGKLISSKYWDENGNEQDPMSRQEIDYFDKIALQLEVFTKNLSEIVESLQKVGTLIIKDDFKNNLHQEITALREEIEKLALLNKQMKLDSGINSAKEAIWKTPRMQESVQEMIDKFAELLKAKIEKIQQTFIIALESILK